MIEQVLFDGKVELGISEIGDGNMRFFGDGDEAEIIKNQEKLGKTLGLFDEKIARVRTIYGDRENFTDFYEITDENLPKYTITNPEREISVSDGLITKRHDIGILLPLADCLGIVVFDEKHQVIGLLHSGRQNIEQDGPKEFIDYFVRNFGSDPSELKIYFSPHAVNYQIFKFGNKFLPEVAKEQLVEAGVLLENIIDFKIDTVGSVNLPSHSSGDKTQRFAIVMKQN